MGPLEPPSVPRRFAPGDVVKAHFAEGRWYHAEVEEDLGDGRYAIAWFDGDCSQRWKRADELRLQRFCQSRSCYEDVEEERPSAEPGPGAAGDEQVARGEACTLLRAAEEEKREAWSDEVQEPPPAQPPQPDCNLCTEQEAVVAEEAGVAEEALAEEQRGEAGSEELQAAVSAPVPPLPPEPAPLRLQVVGLGGQICEIAAVSSWTIADVKAAVEFETETAPALQRLFVGSTELDNSDRLEIRFPAGGCVELTMVRMPRAPEHAEWLEKVEVDGRQLRFAPQRIREDREVVLAAVSECGRALEYASAELRANRVVVLAAVKADAAALEFAAPEVRMDQQVQAAARAKADEWLQRVKADGMRLGEAPAPFRADRRVVQAALASTGRALRFAAPTLQADRWLVLAAVRANGQALQHASAQLRGDSKVVLAAIAQNAHALEFASEKLRGDRGVVLEAVRKEAATLQYASERMKTDREVVLEAVRRDGLALAYASARLKGDREVVLAAAHQNSLAAKFATDEMRANPDVLRAVRGEGASIDTRAYKPPGTPSALLPGRCPFEGIAWVIRSAMPGWDDFAVDFTVRSLARVHISGVQSLAMALWPGSGGSGGEVEVNRRLAAMGLPILEEKTLIAIRKQCKELPQPALNPRGRA